MFDFDEIEDASWKAGFYTEPQKKNPGSERSGLSPTGKMGIMN